MSSRDSDKVFAGSIDGSLLRQDAVVTQVGLSSSQQRLLQSRTMGSSHLKRCRSAISRENTGWSCQRLWTYHDRPR